ncbi:MAG: hypothetical protein U5L45_07800 [Saprospiraceae bacterium]|nr:hypothetical protein [Saprospiraceae bacterium]
MAAFQAIRSEWRQSVRVELAKVAETDLIKFVFSKAEFDSSTEEFKHKGSYYDVVRVELQGDSLIVSCFNDAIETRLINKFHNLIVENHVDTNDFLHKTALCFQSLIKDFYFPTVHSEKLPPSVCVSFKAVFAYKSRFIVSQYLPTETPPPNV